MPPGEEDDEQFVDYVGVGDIEVVLESAHRDPFVELGGTVSLVVEERLFKEASYVLFHVLLACHYSAFSNLVAHLGRGITHEVPKLWISITWHASLRRYCST